MYGHDAEPRGLIFLWSLYQITNPAEIRGDRNFLETEEIPAIKVIAQNLGYKTFPFGSVA